jgi:crossover junction endodeoxyribonuclease RusA
VKVACKRAFVYRRPITSPLLLRIVFFMPRPKSLKGPVGCVTHDKRPDIDNLSKAVMDAMTGIAFKDDGIIASLHAEKWYAEKDHRHTGAQVRLFLLD